jgi:hypothetical protein
MPPPIFGVTSIIMAVAMASKTDSDVPAEFGLSLLLFSFAWLSASTPSSLPPPMMPPSPNDDMTGGVGGIRGDRSGDARGDGGGWMVVECGPMDPGPPPRVHDDDDKLLVFVVVVVIGSGTGVITRRRSNPTR